MLSDAAPGTPADREQASTIVSASIVTRKIWLPRLVYDFLPYFYLTAGFAAFFTTLYISHWFWVLPHYLLFSVACIHFGAFVIRKRRQGPVESKRDEDEEPASN